MNASPATPTLSTTLLPTPSDHLQNGIGHEVTSTLILDLATGQAFKGKSLQKGPDSNRSTEFAITEAEHATYFLRSYERLTLSAWQRVVILGAVETQWEGAVTLNGATDLANGNCIITHRTCRHMEIFATAEWQGKHPKEATLAHQAANEYSTRRGAIEISANAIHIGAVAITPPVTLPANLHDTDFFRRAAAVVGSATREVQSAFGDQFAKNASVRFEFGGQKYDIFPIMQQS